MQSKEFKDLSNENEVVVHDVASSAACGAICDQNSDCVAFEFEWGRNINRNDPGRCKWKRSYSQTDGIQGRDWVSCVKPPSDGNF